VRDLATAGACGLIVPDLPMEEAPALLVECDERGVALVPLVAPTTPDERLAAIGARARGFLYTVSVTGTTGERGDLSGGLERIVTRAKAHTEVPVAVGFGIGTPEQAAAAAWFARLRRPTTRRRPSPASSPISPRPCAAVRMPPAMGLVVATTIGLVAWIVLWAIGVKAFDAFLVTIAVVLLAAVARILAPFLPGERE
jgi:hypothetical protein